MQRRSSDSPPVLSIDTDDLAHVSTLQNSNVAGGSDTKSDEAGASEKSSPAQLSSTQVDTFDWDAYLEQTNGTMAPDCCFNQSNDIPTNRFEEDMRLEMRDPRGGNDTICLANVESKFGVWVCTRLEGCDSSNDRWIICDDDDLHPVGFAESLNTTLTPPIGYLYNLAKHKSFVEKQLRDKDRIAPAECFRPLSPSQRPSRNLFKVGHKLEAVDIKNFNGSMYPSTVTAVDGDYIDVNFDGYTHGYNIKVPFYSREIFPCGWGNRAGVPVSKPPKLKVKLPKGGNRQGKRSLPAAETTPAPTPPPVAKRPKTSADKTPVSIVQAKAARRSATPTQEKQQQVPTKPREDESGVYTPCYKEPISASATIDSMIFGKSAKAKKTLPTPHISVDVTQSPSANDEVSTTPAGPLKEEKPIATTTGGGDGSVPGAPPAPTSKKSISISSPNMSVSKVAGLAQHADGIVADVTTSTAIKDDEDSTLTVHTNTQCACGPYLDPQILNTYRHLTLGPHPLMHCLREVLQTLINATTLSHRNLVLSKMQHLLKRFESVTSKSVASNNVAVGVTADVSGTTKVIAVPTICSATDAWHLIDKLLYELQACPNLLSRTDTICDQCAAVTTTTSGSNGTSTSHQNNTSAATTANGQPTTAVNQSPSSTVHSPPFDEQAMTQRVMAWTVADVVRELREVEDETVLNAVQQHAIDGKALFLLTTDLMVKYMGLRLGPALKVVEWVEKFKAKMKRQRQQR